MPELPEVETVRRGLQHHLPDKRLDTTIIRTEQLRKKIPKAQISRLCGQKCTHIQRRGKYILIFFNAEEENTVLIHLGMSGRLFLDHLQQQNIQPDWEKHEHWRMRFGEKLLRFFDPRRFGILDLIAGYPAMQHPSLKKIGPEPLEQSFSPTYLFQSSRKRPFAIKNFLMNAQIVAGIGNIYASEVCFHAKIRPQRPAGEITKKEANWLFKAIQKVLLLALECGGTTLNDFCGLERKTGTFQKLLSVYGSEGLPCLICKENIQKITLGQRSSFYCPKCQH